MSIVLTVDSSDPVAALAAQQNGEGSLNTQNLTADPGLIIVLLTGVTAAVNAVTAIINNKLSSKKNIIKIDGITYELKPATKNEIIEAINEHFK